MFICINSIWFNPNNELCMSQSKEKFNCPEKIKVSVFSMITTPHSSVSTWVWPPPWSRAFTLTFLASMITLHTSTCHLITSRWGMSQPQTPIHQNQLTTHYYIYLLSILYEFFNTLSPHTYMISAYVCCPFQLYQVRHDKYQHLYLSQTKVRFGNISMDAAGRYITIMWELRVGKGTQLMWAPLRHI